MSIAQMKKHFNNLMEIKEKTCEDKLFPETGMDLREENNAIVKLLILINTVG